MSRIANVSRNSAWNIASTIFSSVLGFLSRVLFMRILGESYLGISGLFTSIIGVLSFVDLGLASAFTFCFYKPITQNDIPHIQSLLNAFKRVIRYITIFIGAAGVCVIPFLRIFVKGAETIDDAHLILYYLISLATTLISYWLVYKTCYVTAKQEAYRLVPFTMIGNLVTVVLQIAALLFTGNYTVWALSAVLVSIFQRVCMNIYISRRYPETNFTVVEKLPESDKLSIRSNVKGILMHKIGEICVNQTDNIIVSSIIGVAINGLLSNYVLIRTTILGFIGMIQNSIVASLGDLMAQEDKEVQLNVFYTYMMANSWMVGFAMCGIGVLSRPFIALIFGPDKLVDDLAIFFSCVGFYFAYQTYALNALPTAGGKFYLGAWVAVIEGLSNLVVSLIAVNLIGLPGVFFGTLLSQFLNYCIRPFPIFKGMYGEPPWTYFKRTFSYFLTALFPYLLLILIREKLCPVEYTLGAFIILCLATVIIFSFTIILFWHNNKYFIEIIQLMKDKFKKII